MRNYQLPAATLILAAAIALHPYAAAHADEPETVAPVCDNLSNNNPLAGWQPGKLTQEFFTKQAATGKTHFAMTGVGTNVVVCAW